MFEMFQQLMSGVSSDNPVEYVCYFVLCICTFGAFMRFLYTLFTKW